MKKLKSARNYALKFASKAWYVAFQPKSHKFLHKGVPYFCQWESRELAAQIITKEIRTEFDPKWKDSGALNPEEYALWSWNVCGMACLKMILAKSQGKVVPLAVLAKKCTEYGGYVMRGEKIDGLYYRPFVPFVKQEFGLRAIAKSLLTVEDIVIALSQEKFVMASVSSAIRNPKSQPTFKGGHLVLILGYDLEKKTLFLHNPSGNTLESQEYATVTFEQFKKFFGEKGIIVKT